MNDIVDMKRALADMLERATEDTSEQTDDPNIALKLEAAFENFQADHDFRAGQLVQWKRGFKHKKSAGPFVVIDVLDEPIFDNEESAGSPYFREPLDIVLGYIDNDADFVTFYYDHRRFESFEA